MHSLRLRPRDRGSATVEFAVSLPALMLLVFAALAAVMALRVQIECVDAAREGALAAARGADGAAAATRVAPPGASVRLAVDGDLVRATVSVQVNPLGGRLPGFMVSGSAAAAREPSAP